MMMILRSGHTIIPLLLATLVVCHSEDVTPGTVPFHCPESCTCTDLTVDNRALKHARCESVEALHDKQWPVYSLDLSGLGLLKVPAVVEKLRNLTRLNLSHNQLTEVSRIGHRVQELNLSHNRIGSGKLAKIPHFLRKLNLAHNHVTVVPLELMKLDLIQELELAGNPINCSCDTILVRNWLQSRNVWTEDAIKCSTPQNYKGRSWLQVKQSDVCHMTAAALEEEKNIWEDSNDLMMGDQPAAGSGEGHDDAHEDALEDDYMPVDDPRSLPHGEADAELEEGSGASPIDIKAIPRTSDHEDIGSGDDGQEVTTGNPLKGDDEDEGSGEPLVPFPIPRIPDLSSRVLDKDFPSEDDNQKPDEDMPITAPEDHTTVASIGGLGIFVPKENTGESEVPVQEEVATTAPKVLVGTAPGQGSPISTDEPVKADASSEKLYILLGVILAIMVGLILLVVCKQKRARRRNRRNGQADVESAKSRELQDMNKQLIGKPAEKSNTGENAPLMGQRDKSDYARPINGQRDSDMIGFNPYEKPASPEEKYVPLKSDLQDEEPVANIQQPPLESFKPVEKAVSKDSINEKQNEDLNNNNNQFQPITNGYPQTNGVTTSPPNSPAGVHKSKRDEDWEKYTPRSPDMKRYSPVYSPETGRVKIRLSETPKPKTPLLVTRSRSNAGQLILTPNLSQRTPANGSVEATES